MKYVGEYVRKHRRILIWALILATINQVFSLLDPQIFRIVVDNYATKAGSMPASAYIHGIVLLLLASITVAFISRTAKTFQNYYVGAVSQSVGTDLYARGVTHVFNLPYETFENQRSGEILRKLEKVRDNTRTFIENMINMVFLSMVGLIFVIIYSFFVHWTIGVAFIVLIPILGTFSYVISSKIKAAQKEVVRESSELAGGTTETLRNVELVKSLGLEGQEVKRLNDVNDSLLQLELKKIRQIRTMMFLQGTAINATRSSILLLLLILIFHGMISIGQLFALLTYSFFIFGPLSNAGTVIANYQEARAANEALEEILSLEPINRARRTEKISEIKEIRFDNVSFTYSENKLPSVKNVTFSLKGGDTVAFAGISGSGKTTIAKLLVGLYDPKEGSITFNGKDSKTIDFESLRKRISLFSQETQLFAGTIKDNLLFVNPDATDEECLRALRMASADSIIERASKGINTKIGESGIKLSGGERQRISIARALLREPDMIIFDEATSSLDSLTEAEITKTIQEITKSKPELIVVIIAHRLSTIIHADTIYVMQAGSVVESGKHSSLIRAGGVYSKFWKEQNNSRNTRG